MTGALSFEHSTLYANAESLRLELAERLTEWDRNRGLDATALLDAADLDLIGIEVPKYLGGLGFGFRQKVQVAKILSRSSMAFAFSLINTQNVTSRLAEAGGTTHKRDLLPELLAGRRVGSTALTEPGAGSDFAAIATTAQQTNDGWILNGEKAWITNAAISDVIICYAQTEPGSGGRGIASFVVDAKRSGFERLAPYELTGGHIIGTGRFRLDNYRAANEDLLTEPGDGFRSAMSSVNGARIYVAAMCCAMVHSALGIAAEYGSRRTTFGKTLLEHQGLAWSLASVANQLEAAQLLTERAIDALESGEISEVILAAAHAKKFATEMAEPAIAACIQAMGAEGLRDHYPLGRHLADARLANFVDGSTEIQTERIARSLATSYRSPVFEYPEPGPATLVSSQPLDEGPMPAESDDLVPVEAEGPEPAESEDPVPAESDDPVSIRAEDPEPVQAQDPVPIRAVPPLPPETERTLETAPELPPLPPESLRTDQA
ncbi:MAG: acyl-CoA dehydrogenase family protein [Acidimicrobiales bacterium]